MVVGEAGYGGGQGAVGIVGAGSHQLRPSEDLEHSFGSLNPKTPQLAYAQVFGESLFWVGSSCDSWALLLLLFASSSSLIEIFEFSLILLFNF